MLVCVGIIEGWLEIDVGNFEVVVCVFECVVCNDFEYLLELLLVLMQNYCKVGDLVGVCVFLLEMIEYYCGIVLVLVLIWLMEEQEGVVLVCVYFGCQLKDCLLVCGEFVLIDFIFVEGVDFIVILYDFKYIIDQLLVCNLVYCCICCGFGVCIYYWQCLSCKEWGMVKLLLNYVVF